MNWTRLRLCAALAATAGLPASAAATVVDPAFAPSGLVPIGAGSCSVSIADLDGDGSPDLALTNCDSDDVTILLGDGSKGFHPAAGSPIAVGLHPRSAAVADINGDARLDLAVANGGSRDVSILLGNGAGGFGAAPGSPVAVAATPIAVSTADLHGDGRVDVVVTIHLPGGNRVTTLLGDGAGRFASAPAATVALHDGAVGAVADFNGDGRPDLATHPYDECRISIRPGNGAGGFGAGRTISGCFLAVADFNGDGKPDLAVANVASDRVTLRARVLLGNGAGGFHPATGSPIPVDSSGGPIATVADLNGDRKLDLAVTSSSSPSVAVLLGNGAGGLRPAADSPFPVARLSYGVAAADLNGDGKADLAVPVHRPGETGPGEGLAILWQTPSAPGVRSSGAVPGPGAAVFSTHGLITRLAADGNRVAVMTRIKNACGRVVVWTAPGRRSTSFKTEEGCPREDSTIPFRVDELALGAGQVAWITEVGGNSVELGVDVAKLAGGAAKQIAYAGNGYGAGGDPSGRWVGRLLGGGPLLAYNDWRVVCNHRDPTQGYCDGWGPTAENLVRIAAGLRIVVKHGAGACRLAAVGGGRLAVAGSAPWWDQGVASCPRGVGGAEPVTVLAASGAPVAAVAPVEGDPPRAIALSRTQLAVERTFTLDLFDPATGGETKSLPLGPAASLQLAGVNSQLALLRGPRRMVLVRLSDGKLISLPLRLGAARFFCGPGCGTLTTGSVDPQLTEAGLFSAYNVPGATARAKIVFEPTARLLARF